jgi:hypothetical protein
VVLAVEWRRLRTHAMRNESQFRGVLKCLIKWLLEKKRRETVFPLLPFVCIFLTGARLVCLLIYCLLRQRSSVRCIYLPAPRCLLRFSAAFECHFAILVWCEMYTRVGAAGALTQQPFACSPPRASGAAGEAPMCISIHDGT